MTGSSARLRVGSRGSALALAQTEIVLRALRVEAEIVTVTTSGDRRTDLPYAEIGPKGIFAAELQRALLSGEIDVAVHSLKDLAATEPDGLEIAAVLERGDVRDVVVGRTLAGLPAGAAVGTSSARRTALLAMTRPDLRVVPFRGNVDTRLSKVARGDVDAAVMAGVGLVRLGRSGAAADWLDPVEFLPAPGQGAIAIEARSGHGEWLRELDHPSTRAAVEAERTFMREMEGGCQVPLGAWARFEDGTLVCDGFVSMPDGTRAVRGSARGTEAAVGAELARGLLADGARDVLQQARRA